MAWGASKLVAMSEGWVPVSVKAVRAQSASASREVIPPHGILHFCEENSTTETCIVVPTCQIERLKPAIVDALELRETQRKPYSMCLLSLRVLWPHQFLVLARPLYTGILGILCETLK